MSEFIITYHDGDQPQSEEEGREQMAEWMSWMEQHANMLKDKGNPVGITTVMTGDGISEARPKNPLMGYSIIEAGTMEEAVEAISSNPHLKYGGTIEISEIKEPPGM